MKNPEQGITMEHKSFNRIEFYQWMLILRRFEERAKAIYRTGMLQGALHLYIGEEAVAVGVCSVLRDDDYIFSTHRSHGHYLAKTHDVNGVAAEVIRRIAEEGFDLLDAPPLAVGGRDVPTPFSEVLADSVVPQADDVVTALRNVMNHS